MVAFVLTIAFLLLFAIGTTLVYRTRGDADRTGVLSPRLTTTFLFFAFVTISSLPGFRNYPIVEHVATLLRIPWTASELLWPSGDELVLAPILITLSVSLVYLYVLASLTESLGRRMYEQFAAN